MMDEWTRRYWILTKHTLDMLRLYVFFGGSWAYVYMYFNICFWPVKNIRSRWKFRF